MRWVHLTVIILLAAATLLFVLQNRDVVTMSFLGFSVRAPLAILIAVVYVIGKTIYSSTNHRCRPRGSVAVAEGEMHTAALSQASL